MGHFNFQNPCSFFIICSVYRRIIFHKNLILQAVVKLAHTICSLKSTAAFLHIFIDIIASLLKALSLRVINEGVSFWNVGLDKFSRIFLHTLNFQDSSAQMTLFQPPIVQFLYFFANSSLVFLLLSLKNGFFATILFPAFIVVFPILTGKRFIIRFKVARLLSLNMIRRRLRSFEFNF